MDIKKIMNVMASTDAGYMSHTLGMMDSIVCSNLRPIRFLIMTDDVSGVSNVISSYVERSNEKNCREDSIEFFDMTGRFFDGIAAHRPHTNKCTFFRLEAPEVLPKDVDRVLYLDSDILVRKDLSELYDVDFEGNSVVAMRDESCIAEILHGVKARATNFNAGVVLMNLDKMRDDDDFDKMKIVAETRKLPYEDQSLLNIMYKHSVKYMPDKFNYQARRSYINPEYIKDYDVNLDDIVMAHFIWRPKPWARKHYTIKDPTLLDEFMVHENNAMRIVQA